MLYKFQSVNTGQCIRSWTNREINRDLFVCLFSYAFTHAFVDLIDTCIRTCFLIYTFIVLGIIN